MKKETIKINLQENGILYDEDEEVFYIDLGEA